MRDRYGGSIIERVLRLHIDENKTYGEIADGLGATRNMISGIVHRCKDFYMDGKFERRSGKERRTGKR